LVNNDADLYQLMQKPLQALLSGTEKNTLPEEECLYPLSFNGKANAGCEFPLFSVRLSAVPVLQA
ncbi:hypothetical protein, partial [Bacillus tropicus]|uniref:hypothetical protein n=1 Tax=Bacillus tropicus TaxID=2026188 RepID=UPI00164AC8AF